jgi:hypothetical protein
MVRISHRFNGKHAAPLWLRVLRSVQSNLISTIFFLSQVLLGVRSIFGTKISPFADLRYAPSFPCVVPVAILRSSAMNFLPAARSTRKGHISFTFACIDNPTTGLTPALLTPCRICLGRIV